MNDGLLSVRGEVNLFFYCDYFRCTDLLISKVCCHAVLIESDADIGRSGFVECLREHIQSVSILV